MVDDAPVQANRWELYRVLSEPARLRLLALTAEEELAVGELAELLGESQPNVRRATSPLSGRLVSSSFESTARARFLRSERRRLE